MRDNDDKNSKKREKFIEITERRVNQILLDLERLSKCSNRSYYDYSEEDIKKIFKAIKEKLSDTESSFQPTGGEKKAFKL